MSLHMNQSTEEQHDVNQPSQDPYQLANETEHRGAA